MPSRPHDSESAPDTDNVAAGRGLAGPAIGILICSLLGLPYCGASAVWAFVSGSDDARLLFDAPGIFYVLVVAVLALWVIVYAAMLYGSIQMLRRKSRAWAKAASILALLPCNFLVILSVGFGIWGLLVLRQEKVKAVFD